MKGFLTQNYKRIITGVMISLFVVFGTITFLKATSDNEMTHLENQAVIAAQEFLGTNNIGVGEDDYHILLPVLGAYGYLEGFNEECLSYSYVTITDGEMVPSITCGEPTAMQMTAFSEILGDSEFVCNPEEHGNCSDGWKVSVSRSIPRTTQTNKNVEVTLVFEDVDVVTAILGIDPYEEPVVGPAVDRWIVSTSVGDGFYTLTRIFSQNAEYKLTIEDDNVASNDEFLKTIIIKVENIVTPVVSIPTELLSLEDPTRFELVETTLSDGTLVVSGDAKWVDTAIEFNNDETSVSFEVNWPAGKQSQTRNVMNGDEVTVDYSLLTLLGYTSEIDDKISLVESIEITSTTNEEFILEIDFVYHGINVTNTYKFAIPAVWDGILDISGIPGLEYTEIDNNEISLEIDNSNLIINTISGILTLPISDNKVNMTTENVLEYLGLDGYNILGMTITGVTDRYFILEVTTDDTTDPIIEIKFALVFSPMDRELTIPPTLSGKYISGTTISFLFENNELIVNDTLTAATSDTVGNIKITDDILAILGREYDDMISISITDVTARAFKLQLNYYDTDGEEDTTTLTFNLEGWNRELSIPTALLDAKYEYKDLISSNIITFTLDNGNLRINDEEVSLTSGKVIITDAILTILGYDYADIISMSIEEASNRHFTLTIESFNDNDEIITSEFEFEYLINWNKEVMIPLAMVGEYSLNGVTISIDRAGLTISNETDLDQILPFTGVNITLTDEALAMLGLVPNDVVSITIQDESVDSFTLKVTRFNNNTLEVEELEFTKTTQPVVKLIDSVEYCETNVSGTPRCENSINALIALSDYQKDAPVRVQITSNRALDVENINEEWTFDSELSDIQNNKFVYFRWYTTNTNSIVGFDDETGNSWDIATISIIGDVFNRSMPAVDGEITYSTLTETEAEVKFTTNKRIENIDFCTSSDGINFTCSIDVTTTVFPYTFAITDLLGIDGTITLNRDAIEIPAVLAETTQYPRSTTNGTEESVNVYLVSDKTLYGQVTSSCDNSTWTIVPGTSGKLLMGVYTANCINDTITVRDNQTSPESYAQTTITVGNIIPANAEIESIIRFVTDPTLGSYDENGIYHVEGDLATNRVTFDIVAQYEDASGNYLPLDASVYSNRIITINGAKIKYGYRTNELTNPNENVVRFTIELVDGYRILDLNIDWAGNSNAQQQRIIIDANLPQ